ncbi:MAG TPA: acyl carrier protein [Steroidobacteraceae bacterium]|jgi:acyl carrier protein|nr:acyl carrier protein [Steroidobacteraceae bacterium]
MTTLELLQGILVKEFKLDCARLVPEATLKDLNIDSLDLVDLIFRIEDHFDLKIQDDMPVSLVTLNDVATYIDELLRNRPAGGGAQSGADHQS